MPNKGNAPAVVIEVEGGMVQSVKSTTPVRVIVLDADTQTADERSLMKVNGITRIFEDYPSGEIVDVEYVGNILAQVDQSATAGEITQVVVFASGGVTRSVATRNQPAESEACIVVDYDDAEGKSDNEFVRGKLGCSRDEFDKTAKYIW